MALVDISLDRFPIDGSFTIARGSRTEAVVVAVTVGDNGINGRGECVPYARYGETPESVIAQIEGLSPDALADRDVLHRELAPGAARNAVDCALWDLEAKRSKRSLLSDAVPLVTAYTLSLDTPERMEAQARKHAGRSLLKVKVGLDGDEERMRAVREGAPDSAVILDANEGWAGAVLEPMLELCAQLRFDLVEQPLPAAQDGLLASVSHPVPICADESAHTSEGLEALRTRYDAVNIKLDKTGGLTEAFEMKRRARALDFKVMVGCMLGSSLAMAPAVWLAQDADFVDLDGPLLLARDREPGLTYEGDTVAPPEPALWG